MSRYPGAIWKPVNKSRPRRRKGRGACVHIAVSNARSLFGWFSQSSADSHYYVLRDGTAEQYVDTDYVAYAQAGGNATLISLENQGGVTNAEGEELTPAQLETNARIIAFHQKEEGFPIRAMSNSLPSERGIGWHKLGCRPWVVPGGEIWSSAYGKICPGLAKINQVKTEMVSRIAELNAPKKPAPVPVPDNTSEDEEMVIIDELGTSNFYLLNGDVLHWIPPGNDDLTNLAKAGVKTVQMSTALTAVIKANHAKLFEPEVPEVPANG